MNKKIAIFIAGWGLYSADPSYAADAQEPRLYVEAQLSYYVSGNSTSQRSLFWREILFLYDLEDDWGLYAYTAKDEEFGSTFAGVTKYLGDFQVGIGGGTAKYDGRRWDVLNPWLYYNGGAWEGNFYLEYIPAETGSAEWFYKIDLKREIKERFYVGFYGQRWFGTGPMIGVRASENVQFWTSVPLVNKEGGEMDFLFSMTMSF